MEHDSDLAELEQRARSGEPIAKEALCTRERAALIPFCYRYLGDLEAAEDAAQDVLLKLMASDPWPSGSLRAWLLRVGRNHCLDLVRRRQDGRVAPGEPQPSSIFLSPATGPSSAAARADERESLRGHIEALAPQHAEVLMLRYYDELGRKEMAEVLELGEAGVKARLAAAVEALRRRVEGRL